jgi:dTMP kinase
MVTGRFISLEGGEGVGKSTQLACLAAWLIHRGISVVTTREPGGTKGAEAIRQLLLTGDEDRWNARTEALLFAAARADHVSKLIKPALENGQWVLCDRFIDSTRAYQGGAGGVSDDDIMALHNVGSEGLLPDRTFLLSLNVEEGAARTRARDAEIDRMGARDTAFYDRVDARFKEIAVADRERFRIVDASGVVEDVTQRLTVAIEDLV